MPDEIALAVFFGALSMLAQYLPARWGVPIGLGLVVVSLWQLGWVGWPLVLSLMLLALVIWRIIRQRGLLEKDNEAERGHKIVEAQDCHSKILNLDNLLDKTTDNLSKDVNWLDNQDVKDIMDKMQIELNHFGYIIRKRGWFADNSQYDRWAEAFMLGRSKQLRAHYRGRGDMDEWGRTRINAILREFTDGIKG